MLQIGFYLIQETGCSGTIVDFSQNFNLVHSSSRMCQVCSRLVEPRYLRRLSANSVTWAILSPRESSSRHIMGPRKSAGGSSFWDHTWALHLSTLRPLTTL